MSYGSDSTQAQPGQQGGDKNKQATNTTAPLGDGGPAFPVSADTLTQGLSLRDYFAAKAMAAIAGEDTRKGGCATSETAALAYEYADAMLAARKAVGK